MRAVPILLYHAVSERPSDFIAPYTVSPDTFARHLDAVAAAGATTLTLSAYRSAVERGGPLPEHPVVITFDDGFLDTLTVAAPRLADRSMAMTAYITTGVVGGASPGGDPMMSWSQLDELAGLGVEIGAHSHSHPELDTVAGPALEGEIVGCRRLLRERTGRPVDSFAYPHGYSDVRVRRAVAAAGYRSAVSVKNALSSPDEPAFTISRLMVLATTTDAEVAAWVDGTHAPVGQDDERLLTRGWRAYRRARTVLVPATSWV